MAMLTNHCHQVALMWLIFFKWRVKTVHEKYIFYNVKMKTPYGSISCLRLIDRQNPRYDGNASRRLTIMPTRTVTAFSVEKRINHDRCVRFIIILQSLQKDTEGQDWTTKIPKGIRSRRKQHCIVSLFRLASRPEFIFPAVGLEKLRTVVYTAHLLPGCKLTATLLTFLPLAATLETVWLGSRPLFFYFFPPMGGGAVKPPTTGICCLLYRHSHRFTLNLYCRRTANVQYFTFSVCLELSHKDTWTDRDRSGTHRKVTSWNSNSINDKKEKKKRMST